MHYKRSIDTHSNHEKWGKWKILSSNCDHVLLNRNFFTDKICSENLMEFLKYMYHVVLKDSLYLDTKFSQYLGPNHYNANTFFFKYM